MAAPWQPAFDWFEEHAAERSVLDQAQGSKAMGFANAIVKAHDFSDITSVCDIGGGRGTFLMQLLSACPHIKGYVADLPGAVARPKKPSPHRNWANGARRCPMTSIPKHHRYAMATSW